MAIAYASAMSSENCCSTTEVVGRRMFYGPRGKPRLERGMLQASFRLAAYAVCVEGGRVLLARYVSPEGESNWTLPGGQVERGEDPFDAVIRELAEETGLDGVVERLLGVDSRLIPPEESRGGIGHQNVGIFYLVQVIGGELRPEPNGVTAESVWTPITSVVGLVRSSLVDVGIALADSLPATGHVASVPVGGLVQH